MSQERRRADRLPVDLAGELFLSEGRSVPVRIKNVGPLGALVQITDLEEAVLEGERAVLDHPASMETGESTPDDERTRTPCSVVRVELDFQEQGIKRELAVYFDGGPPPDGYVG
ncbi:MAG: hypothetical protein O2894_09000 [Planctomycetota bacterium]|nr:hypothetical protein [Planctomycetota bacterium]